MSVADSVHVSDDHDRFFGDPLATTDPEIYRSIQAELKRQQNQIELIASENIVSRAALVYDAFGARLARQHQDANVVCFGERMIGVEVARDCLKQFLQTEFEGGRHAGRVDKLSNPTKTS